jgi:hypothetical protein
MAGQRWSESRGHDTRGGSRRRRLADLAPLILLLAGCSAEPLAPRPADPGGGFGSGVSSGGTDGSALVGTWRTVVVIQVPGDLQTWTTTWRFDAEGTCRQTIVSESLAEGFPRTTERTCAWTATGAEVTITYVGGGTLTFEYSFAGFSPDRLVLDGYEYQRES